MTSSPTGFRAHFAEASAVNRVRKKQYAQLTGGKSVSVSNLLIFWEKVLFPVAWYFDWRATSLNRKGIGIITNDFELLHNLPDINCQAKYTRVLNRNQLWGIFTRMHKLRCKVSKLLRGYNFKETHLLLVENISWISTKEREWQVHVAMLKHILESAAFATKNAIGYSTTGNVQAKRLARAFIKAQMLGTILSPLLDHSANKIHRLGVGIVVNDVPTLPYL